MILFTKEMAALTKLEAAVDVKHSPRRPKQQRSISSEGLRHAVRFVLCAVR